MLYICRAGRGLKTKELLGPPPHPQSQVTFCLNTEWVPLYFPTLAQLKKSSQSWFICVPVELASSAYTCSCWTCHFPPFGSAWILSSVYLCRKEKRSNMQWYCLFLFVTVSFLFSRAVLKSVWGSLRTVVFCGLRRKELAHTMDLSSSWVKRLMQSMVMSVIFLEPGSFDELISVATR